MESLADTLYVSLRDGIVHGQLPGDALLNEQQIARQYGVSKLTARETLKRLCAEKYLMSYPRRGYLILEMTDAECVQLQQVRFQVEAFAVREIARHASDAEIGTLRGLLALPGDDSDPYGTRNYQFHMAVARLSGSPYIADTMHTYLGPICRYALSRGGSDARFSANEDHHRLLTEALLARDTRSALENLRLDLCLTEEEV